ncbi:Oidioi.mRNA.OKI2018_I69.XSR.g14667.t1.cds [Oikopleura dioica]|uniref:Oidioi.mRNA.OKI2018_I69.XSR.g14667.t1.cds n=1 Tax=Oikopleura dioica TaxID=34765 RepID=A0ABN7SAZ6_OIKDI|nr:Oidioi.mRNA.OKI2018_I69.XSR.g14667.t1.cds [Oikopleura dioica]
MKIDYLADKYFTPNAGPSNRLKKAKTENLTINDVSTLDHATSDFLISAERNVYGIMFTRFILRNMENNQTLIDVGIPKDETDLKYSDENASRFE